MQEIILDEKISKLDEAYVYVVTLQKNYEEYCNSGFSEEKKSRCLSGALELKDALARLDTNMESLGAGLCRIMGGEMRSDMVVHIREQLDKLQQGIKRLYLASIHDEGSYSKVKLENYYKTDFTKKALIVYVVYPFLFSGTSPGHTNQVEVQVMADVLREYGYNVDIVNTRYTGEIEAETYDLVIGSGHFFETLCTNLKEGAISVCYLTSASPYFSNLAAMRRINAFEQRNHVRLPFERLVLNTLDLSILSKMTAAICVGNQWTVSTYEGMFPRIYPLNISGFAASFEPEFQTPRQEYAGNFLWYGGTGALHKGLDLCIEAFRKLPELNLYIVGEPNSELYNFYRADIEQGENIYYYGYLNKDSEEFREVCESCGFCIAPSCSEGQSTSVLTAMFAGMIPVCTKQNGIDMDRCGGVWIEDPDLENLAGLIEKLSKMDAAEINQRRRQAYDYVKNNHTIDHYRANLKRILAEIFNTGRS